MNKQSLPVISSLCLLLAACSSGGGGSSSPEQPVAEQCDGVISGRVWDDVNINGIQDTSEPDTAGVSLVLSADSQSDQQTSSSAQGYQFDQLCAGTYTVAVTVASGFELSPNDVGNDTTDSDIIPASGASTAIAVSTNAVINNIDVGLSDPQTRDRDNDGVADANDAFPDDPNESADSDGDSVGDNADAFPQDPAEYFDSDGDGTGDNSDAFINDPAESSDSDDDGVGDNTDRFPNNPNEQFDSDDDGVGDNSDAFPNNALEQYDADGDGVGDNADPSPQPVDPGKVAANFSAIYSVGDSVTTGRAPDWGQFYAQKVSVALGVPLQNAAKGGWTLADILNGRDGFNQLEELYGAPRVADPNGLHIVYGGYNDVFFRPDPYRFDVVNESAQNLGEILLAIANAGGRFALVPLLYDVGRQIASDADGRRTVLRDRTIDFNNAALSVINDVNSGTDLTVLSYDVFLDVEEIYANPAGNGFTNLTDACEDTQLNCQGYFWWDSAHPADDFHRVIADGIVQLLQDNS